MNWALAVFLIAGAVVTARPGSAARERLLGRPKGIDPARLLRLAPVVLTGRRLVLFSAGTAAVVAGVLGGPVGALIAATYAGLGAHEWNRAGWRRRIAARRATELDDLAHLVAELRAGIPPVIVAAAAARPDSGSSGSSGSDARMAGLTVAVWRLAERTGAPAADLLERIEWDARAADRSAKAASAQASGAQTTAGLLAALPLVGIGMGYAIGGDPIEELLHTRWGACCAVGALILQCSGLKWAQRLTAKVAA